MLGPCSEMLRRSAAEGSGELPGRIRSPLPLVGAAPSGSGRVVAELTQKKGVPGGPHPLMVVRCTGLPRLVRHRLFCSLGQLMRDVAQGSCGVLAPLLPHTAARLTRQTHYPTRLSPHDTLAGIAAGWRVSRPLSWRRTLGARLAQWSRDRRRSALARSPIDW